MGEQRYRCTLLLYPPRGNVNRAYNNAGTQPFSLYMYGYAAGSIVANTLKIALKTTSVSVMSYDQKKPIQFLLGRHFESGQVHAGYSSTVQEATETVIL